MEKAIEMKGLRLPQRWSTLKSSLIFAGIKMIAVNNNIK